MERGKVVVERVGGKSTVTRCFSKYPLKLIIPNKVGPAQTDAVWIYTITYGGGIVSGDSIGCDITVGDGCTAVLTTQSSTKVYKCVGSKSSEQNLEASIGKNALLAVIPDPVTCFSTAKYSQLQIFKVVPESSLLLVDWITSGRHERGEKWAFSFYKSTNRILTKGDEPLFLDTALLEQGNHGSISDHLQDYQSIAMIVLLGPKLKHVQHQIQEDVKKLMSEQLHVPSFRSGGDKRFPKPTFIASCSVFGPKGIGVVVRVASMTTESIYKFLQHELAAMKPLLGVSPYL
ncbi:urease accessory protein D-like [Dorcoceras hygrometricum]|uniref:Urease accessory protein D-like n=1 Tax=Dorcoceras hygrometricum TaxID=472368 RepID=A0A2Z7BQ23_9LAMI|nr:urease accessory protein D-like [Dorcoceras hygrometricum]